MQLQPSYSPSPWIFWMVLKFGNIRWNQYCGAAEALVPRPSHAMSRVTPRVMDQRVTMSHIGISGVPKIIQQKRRSVNQSLDSLWEHLQEDLFRSLDVKSKKCSLLSIFPQTSSLTGLLLINSTCCRWLTPTCFHSPFYCPMASLILAMVNTSWITEDEKKKHQCNIHQHQPSCDYEQILNIFNVEVSWNRVSLQSSILVAFPITNHLF